MKNLPKKIYLDFNNPSDKDDDEVDFKEVTDITWSDCDIRGRNIGYINLDVIENIKKEIKEEIVRLEKLEKKRVDCKDYAGALRRESEREACIRIFATINSML